MSSLITIRQPSSAEEFEHYFRLRWKILRRPWGQPEGSERDEMEEQTFHAAAFTEDGQVVGAARLQFNSEAEAQVRYMAVAKQVQRQGIGMALLRHLEEYARKKGAKVVVLDARESAVPFYLKLGYEIVGDSYLLFGDILHKKMRKWQNS